MGMATMRMIVQMLMVRVNVALIMVRIVAVGMCAHRIYCTCPGGAPQPCRALIGQFDTAPRELIDALAGGCDHETSFPLRACWRGGSIPTGVVRSRP